MLKYIVIYGLSFVGIVISIQFIRYNYWLSRIDDNVYGSLIALVFLVLGIYLARTKNPKVQNELLQPLNSNIALSANDEMAEKLNISKRELEVLLLLTKGYTNQEIADELFISLNTAKTHISNIYLKLDVTKRTKAIAKAKELCLIS